ncbi:MAG: hypothetical protein ACXW0Q_10610, partial [Methylovulum sp.]
MDSPTQYKRPFLLALALHLTLLGLFALSALIKPKRPELATPSPEIIHATMFDASEIEAQEQAIKQAKATEEQAVRE